MLITRIIVSNGYMQYNLKSCNSRSLPLLSMISLVPVVTTTLANSGSVTL